MVRGAPISTTTEIRYKTRMMKNKLNIQTSFRTHKGAPIFQGRRGEFAIGVPLGAPRRLYGDIVVLPSTLNIILCVVPFCNNRQ